jgi:hypothetical protein
MKNPYRSPEIIRLTVMMYVRYSLSLRPVEDLLFERGIDICHETVRFWWSRFGQRHGRKGPATPSVMSTTLILERIRSFIVALSTWRLAERFKERAIMLDLVVDAGEP